MLKLSKNHQFGLKLAAEDELSGSDVAEKDESELEREELKSPVDLCVACKRGDHDSCLIEGDAGGVETDDYKPACSCECYGGLYDIDGGLDTSFDKLTGDTTEDELGPEPFDNDGEADDTSEDRKSYDARREAATPHANAAKDLFAKRRKLMQQVNALDDQLSNHREVLRALDPKMKHEAYADDKELKTYLKPQKLVEEKKKKKKKLDKHSEKYVLDGLLKVADVLDYAGDLEGVSLVENMLRTFAKQNEIPKYDLNTIEKTERKYPDMAAVPPSMSTRNCPDHHGAQMQRVAEGTFQCELDGKMYNWNQGFKDYSGNVYPSAPIRSVDFPNVSERMFETRQMATNKSRA